MLGEIDIQVVITDLQMPSLNGREVIEKIKKLSRYIDVIVITGYATIETAVEIMKLGVVDFLSKPLDFKQVKFTLNKINERINLHNENLTLREDIDNLKLQLEERYRYDNIIGKSKLMQEVFSALKK